MYHFPLAFNFIYGRSDGGENGDEKEGREGREWRFPDLLYLGLVSVTIWVKPRGFENNLKEKESPAILLPRDFLEPLGP